MAILRIIGDYFFAAVVAVVVMVAWERLRDRVLPRVSDYWRAAAIKRRAMYEAKIEATKQESSTAFDVRVIRNLLVIVLISSIVMFMTLGSMMLAEDRTVALIVFQGGTFVPVALMWVFVRWYIYWLKIRLRALEQIGVEIAELRAEGGGEVGGE